TQGDSVSWLDCPFDLSKAWKDGEHKGLSFLASDMRIQEHWRSFWPRRGNPPNWDAVGRLTKDGISEWLLVESKSHIAELASSCKASPNGGLPQIEKAFAETK